jgi:hypothetical protein
MPSPHTNIDYWAHYDAALRQCLEGLRYEISSATRDQDHLVCEAESAIQEVLLSWQQQHLNHAALERLHALRPALPRSAIVQLGSCLELIRTWSLEIEEQHQRDSALADTSSSR